MTTPTSDRGQVRMSASTKERLDAVQDEQAQALGIRVTRLSMDRVLDGMATLARMHPAELTEILRGTE